MPVRCWRKHFMPEIGHGEKIFLNAWAQTVVAPDPDCSQFKRASRELIDSGYSGKGVYASYVSAMSRISQIGELGPDTPSANTRETLTRFLFDTTYSEGVLRPPEDEMQFEKGNRILIAAGVDVERIIGLVTIAHLSARAQSRLGNII